MRAYPAKIVRDGKGWSVAFRDVPEAITCGAGAEEAAAHAVDALESALSFYIDARKPLPAPSKLKRGERMIHLSAVGMAKIELYAAMRAGGVGRAELARRMGCHLEQVARLLDLTHESKIEQIERALAAVGRRMIVRTEAA